MKKKCENCQAHHEHIAARRYDHPCFDHTEPCSYFRLAITRDIMLQRYPRLISHLICESLGYFTPLSAANAVAFYKIQKPFGKAFFCEWYSHMAQFEPGSQGLFDERCVREVGKRTLKYAFQHRHHHHGYMNEIKQAQHIVAAELQNAGSTSSMLASWF